MSTWGAAGGSEWQAPQFFGVPLVSNQSGVGRGAMAVDDLIQVDRYLATAVAASGGWIEASFYCCHEPDAGCGCRKPHVGLLRRAVDVVGEIDLGASFMIGDQPTDIEAGRQFGLRTIQVRSTHPRSGLSASVPEEPTFKTDDLLSAVHLVMRENDL